MTTVYDLHDKAFARVSAYALLKDGKFIGRVNFKSPADGAGRLQCFFQIWGTAMSRGTADGYGYDKLSAAFAKAVENYVNSAEVVTKGHENEDTLIQDIHIAANLRENQGLGWYALLRKMGIEPQHVI